VEHSLAKDRRVSHPVLPNRPVPYVSIILMHFSIRQLLRDAPPEYLVLQRKGQVPRRGRLRLRSLSSKRNEGKEPHLGELSVTSCLSGQSPDLKRMSEQSYSPILRRSTTSTRRLLSTPRSLSLISQRRGRGATKAQWKR
jgi:hypothetical protein